MQRKQFILATLACTPLFGFPHMNVPGRTKKPFVIRGGKSRFNEIVKFQGVNLNDIKISKKDTNNELSVFEYTGFQKTGPPLHLHFSQDEIFYVTEGKYRFVAGDEKLELGSGDCIFLPRNIPHTWLQVTDKGKLLYMVQPAGTMEEFFRELSALTKPPTEKEIKKIHLDHGMKVMGPPLG